MLEWLAAEEIRRIAQLAKEARVARDQILDGIPDDELVQIKPARGEHIPTAGFGLDPLSQDHPARLALREALATLRPESRRELLALLWVGRDDYAVADWDRAIADATTAFEVTPEKLMEEADLHEFLTKGLYELKVA